jgi:hypothetical protein
MAHPFGYRPGGNQHLHEAGHDKGKNKKRRNAEQYVASYLKAGYMFALALLNGKYKQADGYYGHHQRRDEHPRKSNLFG